VETIEKTNEKVQVLIEDHTRVRDLKIDPLSMLLNGVVDPAVNGGISQYKVNQIAGARSHLVWDGGGIILKRKEGICKQLPSKKIVAITCVSLRFSSEAIN